MYKVQNECFESPYKQAKILEPCHRKPHLFSNDLSNPIHLRKQTSLFPALATVHHPVVNLAHLKHTHNPNSIITTPRNNTSLHDLPLHDCLRGSLRRTTHPSRRNTRSRGRLINRIIRPHTSTLRCNSSWASNLLERNRRVIRALEPVEAEVAAWLEGRREGVASAARVNTTILLAPAL